MATDEREGLRLVEQGARAGDKVGTVLLGRLYWDASLYERAFEWNQIAAKAGDANAKYLMGEAYKVSKGAPQNDQLAVQWFEAAYLAGSPDGTYRLAEAYEFGQGKKLDPEKANQLHALALARGSEKEQNRMAVLNRK